MPGMNPIGEFFQAREGGLHCPLDRTAFDRIQAQAAQGTGEAMEVTGVGYRYGVVGWFGLYGAIRIEAGAFIEAPGKHRKYRDAMGSGYSTITLLMCWPGWGTTPCWTSAYGENAD